MAGSPGLKSTTNLFASGPLGQAFRKWYFGLSGYNKLGLYHNDLIYTDSEVEEALKRLTPEQFHDRQFRIIRAFHLATTDEVLREDEWVSFEENQKYGRYLEKHIDQVNFEIKERESWDTGNVQLNYKF